MSILPPRRSGPLTPLEQQQLEALQKRGGQTPQADVIDLQTENKERQRRLALAARVARFNDFVSYRISAACRSESNERFIKPLADGPYVDRRAMRAWLTERFERVKAMLIEQQAKGDDEDRDTPLMSATALNSLIEMAVISFVGNWNAKS
jgi:hypothetical protein